MKEPGNRDYLLLRAYQAGIRDPSELASFMGQMQVESANFRSMHENLNYRPRGLLETFPGRNGMDTLEEARAIVSIGREHIANSMYGGKWDAENLGNTKPGDGWRFHGRGYVQLTGRSNYARAETQTGLPLEGSPDLAANREIAARLAMTFWKDRVVANNLVNDAHAATHAINGGHKHLRERIEAIDYWKRLLTPSAMKALEQGKVDLTPRRGKPLALHDGKEATPASNVSEAHDLPDLRAPSHPGHPRYREAFAGVTRLDHSLGRASDAGSERVAASLAAACAHLERIDRVCLSEDGRRIFGLQDSQHGGMRKMGIVDTGIAINQRVETSSRQWEANHARDVHQPAGHSRVQAAPAQAATFAPVMGS